MEHGRGRTHWKEKVRLRPLVNITARDPSVKIAFCIPCPLVKINLNPAFFRKYIRKLSSNLTVFKDFSPQIHQTSLFISQFEQFFLTPGPTIPSIFRLFKSPIPLAARVPLRQTQANICPGLAEGVPCVNS